MSYAKFILPVLALFVAGLFAAISITAQPAQADGPDHDARPRHEFSLTARWNEAAGAALLSWQPLPDAHSYWIQLTDNTENRPRWLPQIVPDQGKERYIHRVSGLSEKTDYAFQVIARRKNTVRYRDNWSNPSELIRLTSRAASLSAVLPTPKPRTGPMPVCDRTPEVVAELIRQTGKSRCSEVTTGDLALVALVDLHLREVPALKPGDFDSLPNLTELILSKNEISELHPDLFQNLPNLTQLWLHTNRISELHPDLFQNLPELSILYLGHNHLTEIEPGTFRNLPRLKRLWIQDNQLASIDPNLFNNLPKLQYLALCGNKLTVLEPGTFAELTGLRVLDLCQNPGLTQLPPGLFPKNAELRILGIRDNNIANIRPDAFENLPALHSLAISGNPLTTLDYQWFNNLPKLTSLDIDENLLSDLHPFAKEQLNRLRSIDIHSSLENLDKNIDRARKLNAQTKFVYTSRERIWDHGKGSGRTRKGSPTRNSLIGIP